MDIKQLKLGLILSCTDKMSVVVDKAFGKSKRTISSFESKTNKTGGQLLKVGGGITGAGMAVAGSLFAMSKSVAGEAKEIVKGSQRIGMSTDNFQIYSKAAQKAGVESDKFTGSIAKLQKLQMSAAMGSKGAATAFKMAGIGIYDTNGKLKSSNVLISELSDKFKDAPNGPKKTAIAMMLLGKSGASMIPMLNKGSKGISDVGKAMKDSGNLISKDGIAQSMKFNAAQKQMTERLNGVKKTLGIQVMPLFVKLADKVLKVVTAVTSFINRHKEMASIALKVAGVLIVLGGALTTVGSVLKTLSLIVKAYKFLQLAFNAGLLACPAVTITMAIIGLAAVAYLLYKNWGSIVSFFKNLWEKIKSLFMSAAKKIIQIIIWTNPILLLASLIYKNWDKIKSFFKNAIKSFKEFGKNLLNGLKEGIMSFIHHPIDAIKKVAEKIKNKFKSIFGIHSPSKVFAEFGVNMNEGLRQGVESSSPRAEGAIKKVANNSVNTLNNTSNNVGGKSVIVNYSPTINMHGGGDKNLFVNELKKHKADLARIIQEIQNGQNRVSFA